MLVCLCLFVSGSSICQESVSETVLCYTAVNVSAVSRVKYFTVVCVWQVFEGVAASKKQAMHVAARQALAVMGEPVTSDGETPIKMSAAGKVQPAIDSGKNPVMIINEVNPDAEFQLVSENGEGMNKSFVMSVDVNGQTFHGSGRSKRAAKAHAAMTALCEMYGVVAFSSPGERVLSSLWSLQCFAHFLYSISTCHTKLSLWCTACSNNC